MNNKIKTAFDNIHAEEEIKQSTKAFIAEKTNNYSTKKGSGIKHFAMAMACFALVLVGVKGYAAYKTPVSEISVDINPSFEIELNRFDRVISVVGYNDDGEALADTLNLKNMSYQAAVEKIKSNESINNYMEKGELLTITVVGNSEVKSQEMLNYVSSCMGNSENVACHLGTSEESKAAHKVGLSIGKYRAFLRLYELDPTVTVDDVKKMTMRQIQNRIDEMSGGSADTEHNGNCGNDENMGNGKGKCNGVAKP